MDNFCNTLQTLRVNNPLRIIVGQLNINSIRNKFDALCSIFKQKIDILLVSETKIDDTFPLAQFCVEGYSTPYRLCRTCKGGGLLLYVRDDIPSKQIKLKSIENEAFKEFFVEINLRKKCLLCCSYNPDKNKTLSYLPVICKALDDLSKKYDNFILLGDFNNEQEEKSMSNFLNTYHLKNTVKQTTSFKNTDRPSYIDLILTNSTRSFQDTCTVETGLSDFHKLVVTVLKLYFLKQKPNIQTFRDYKRFQNDLFRSELDYELSKLDVCNLEFEHFLNIFIEILNKHVPINKKYLRANQGEFMSKELNKAIMTHLDCVVST